MREAWWNDYVGIPFRPLGTSRRGVDCWGLFILVQREVFGLEYPAFNEMRKAVYRSNDPDVSTFEETADMGPFPAHKREPGEVPQSGDLIHMWGMYGGRRLPMHVGIVTEPGYMLHSKPGVDSCIERYTTPNMRRLVIAIWGPE